MSFLLSAIQDRCRFPRLAISGSATCCIFFVASASKRTLTDNPYLASVGLFDGFLDQRLRALAGVTYRRMAHLTDFEWDASSLATWAETML